MKNKVCVCGSGKKQKDCCADCFEVKNWIKDKGGNTTAGESYWIKLEPMPSVFAPADEEEYFYSLEILEGDPNGALTILKKLLSKYPGDSDILLNIASAYAFLDRKEESYELFKKNYAAHPERVLSRVMLGMYYLDQNQADKIPILLDNKYDLKLLYPEKKVFHITEFLVFSFFLATYYFTINELDKANIYLDLLKQFDKDDQQIILLEEKIAAKQRLLKSSEKIVTF